MHQGILLSSSYVTILYLACYNVVTTYTYDGYTSAKSRYIVQSFQLLRSTRSLKAVYQQRTICMHLHIMNCAQVSQYYKAATNLCRLKLRLISQAGEFYYRLCPEPTPTEYTAMATTLCDSYAQLKDKHIDDYWVR